MQTQAKLGRPYRIVGRTTNLLGAVTQTIIYFKGGPFYAKVRARVAEGEGGRSLNQSYSPDPYY